MNKRFIKKVLVSFLAMVMLMVILPKSNFMAQTANADPQITQFDTNIIPSNDSDFIGTVDWITTSSFNGSPTTNSQSVWTVIDSIFTQVNTPSPCGNNVYNLSGINVDSNAGGAAIGTAYKTFSVSDISTLIDAGFINMNASAFIYKGHTNDEAKVDISFYDSNNVILPQSITLNAYNSGAWYNASQKGQPVPSGTRMIKVTLSGNTSGNPYDDVNFDGISVILHNNIPSVTGFTSLPSSSTYKTGDVLDFSVKFNNAVTVTGKPFIPITINKGGTERAYYQTGGGTDTLVFSYTVASGEEDPDGITLGYMINLNGGTIKNGSIDAILSFTPPYITGIKVDGVQPMVTEISAATANGAYKAGDPITIYVVFSEGVICTGVPQLTLRTGAVDRISNYLDGSNSNMLAFNYTVQPGDNSGDLDYASTAALLLNGGSIKDSAGNDAVLTLPSPGAAGSLGYNRNIVIDTTPPNCPSNPVLTASTDTGYSNTDKITNGANLQFTGTAEAGSTVKIVSSLRGPLGTTTADSLGNWYFDIPLLNEGNHNISVIATDAAGNPSTPSPSLSVIIDNTAPTASVTAASTAGGDGIVNVSEKAAGFNVAARSSEAASKLYVVPSGTPKKLTDIINSSIGSADSAGANADTTITISKDNPGVIDGNSYCVYAVDTAGNISDISGSAFTAYVAHPYISSVEVPSDGTYKAGQALTFTVHFNKSVYLDAFAANSFILIYLDTGGLVEAKYSSSSGSDTFNFVYTVASGNVDTNGITVCPNLILSGALIRDAAGNDILTGLNSVPNTSSIFVDTIIPEVSSVDLPSAGTYKAGSNLDIKVNFNKNITVITTGGTPYIPITLDTGGTVNAAYIGSEGGKTLVFRYTVQTDNNDSDGINVGSVIILNGGIIRDAATNDGLTDLNGVGSTSSIHVDAIAPVVTTVNVPLPRTYGAGQELTFKVNFSEPVYVDTTGGTPKIDIRLNTGGTVSALYDGGSGSSSLTFKYRIQPGNSDSDGITVNPIINPNGGTIRDNVGNDIMDSSLRLVEPTTGVLIDTILPTLTISSTSSEPTNVSPIHVTFTFSKNVTGFTAGDINVGNGMVDTFNGVDSSTYTADIIPSGQGLVTVDVGNGAAEDSAGNGSCAAVQLTRNYDSIAPVVDDNNASTVYSLITHTLTIKMTETGGISTGIGHSGIDINKITVKKGTQSEVLSSGQSAINIIDASTIRVVIGGTDLTVIQNFTGGEGIDSIDVAAGGITDIAGNTNVDDLDNYVTTDYPPTILSAARDNDTHITVSLSEDCSNLIKDNTGGFTVYENGTGKQYNVTNIRKGNDSSYVVLTVDNFAVSASKGLVVKYTAGGDGNIEDMTGNALATDARGVEISPWDTTPPNVISINRKTPAQEITNSNTLIYTITFSETVTGVDKYDFSLTTTGTAAGNIASVSAASGDTIDVTVNGVTGAGTLKLNLKSSGTNIADISGNAIEAGYSNGQTYTYDNVSPVLNAGAVNRTSYMEGTVKFTTNESGQYYYAVVAHGAAEPTIDTKGNGISCTTAETTIKDPIGLASGKKDIYIKVKDAAGNVSNAIMIEIPDYVAPYVPHVVPRDEPYVVPEKPIVHTNETSKPSIIQAEVVNKGTGENISPISATVKTEIDGTKTVELKAEDTLIVEGSSGTKSTLIDTSKIGFTSPVVSSENGKQNPNVLISIAPDGTIKVSGLANNSSAKFEVNYDLGNGQKISIGTMNVKVDANGNVSIVYTLVDPYGTITDSATKKPIPGVNAVLYFANTERNKANGKAVDTVVNLPEIPGFKPNNNINPQISTENGEYGWMVFPDSDYYIVATVDGYKKYVSPTISVEKEIVKWDFSMEKINGDAPSTENNNSTIVTDTAKPVITLNGASEVTIKVGDVYKDEGAKAADSKGNDLTDKLVITNDIDTSKAGDYEVTYKVADAKGNTADKVTRIVHVIEGAKLVKKPAVKPVKPAVKPAVKTIIIAASADKISANLLKTKTKGIILSPNNYAAIKKYKSVSTVYIIGGSKTINSALEKKLKSFGIKNIVKISGKNVKETYNLVKKRLKIKVKK